MNDTLLREILEHVRHIRDGPIIRTPGLHGALVVSLCSGDLVVESGQDLSLGISTYDADEVRFDLEDSLRCRVVSPKSTIALDI